MEDESINDLKVEKMKLVGRAREILASADKNEGVLTTEEDNNYKKVHDRISAINKTITAKNQMLELERDEVQNLVNKDKTPAKNKDMDLILNSLKHGSNHILNTAQGDNDSTGGFIKTPSQFRQMLIDEIDSELHIRRMATVFKTKNINGIGFPTLESSLDDADWSGEISETKESKDMTFGKRELKSYALSKLVTVSNDLIRADGLDIVRLIIRKLAYKFAMAQEKGFIDGDGQNKPLGILTKSKDGISASRWINAGNTATVVKFDNLKNVKASVHQKYRARASWLLNSDLVLAYSKIKDANDQYIWQPSIKDGEHDRLLGRPIIESEFMPKTLTSGLAVGAFADFSQYYIHDFINYEFQVLKELYATKNKTAFLARLRCDGMPVDEKAFAIIAMG
ncbi:MAG: phage major capsid protein [Candidatus Cloacimonadota bacterium]|nr:MAG: phage major capsid protein [Candidatus Cloacimonadota bacterium]